MPRIDLLFLFHFVEYLQAEQPKWRLTVTTYQRSLVSKKCIFHTFFLLPGLNELNSFDILDRKTFLKVKLGQLFYLLVFGRSNQARN